MIEDFSEEFARKPLKEFVMPAKEETMKALHQEIRDVVTLRANAELEMVEDLLIRVAGLSRDDEYENIAHQRLKRINLVMETRFDQEGRKVIFLNSDRGILGFVTVLRGGVESRALKYPWGRPE